MIFLKRPQTTQKHYRNSLVISAGIICEKENFKEVKVFVFEFRECIKFGKFLNIMEDAVFPNRFQSK